MPGQLKIGETENHPELRAKELASTGVPEPFEVECFFEVKDAMRSERLVHEALGKHRVRHNREFFRCDLKTAISEANKILRERGEFISVEDRNAMAAEAERRRQEETEHQEYERRKKDGRDRLLENAILALEMQESGKSLVEVGHHFLREGRYKPNGEAYATFDIENLIPEAKKYKEFLKQEQRKMVDDQKLERQNKVILHIGTVLLVLAFTYGIFIYPLLKQSGY
jgi:hypothetical protein